MNRAAGALTVAGSCLAIAGAAHAAVNLARLRRPRAPQEPGQDAAERVDVLIPARNEAHRIAATISSVLAQRSVPGMRVHVLDDGSSDATAQVVADTAAGDPRLTLHRGTQEPPPGWLGKPYACQRLAAASDAGIMVFLDADVVLRPDAVAAVLEQLRSEGADFASPWPQQLASGVLGRLVQPMQQWSWATTLPLDRLARSPRPSLAAANGQFLVIRRTAYDAIGGHRAVADCVLEDIELARAMKRAGRRTALWNGNGLASCRMYDSAADLRAGYRKSLWAAFGPNSAPLSLRAAAALGAWTGLALAYLVPPAAMLVGPGPALRAVGAAGTAAGMLNRALVAGATGSPVWPDSLAHPASVVVFIAMSADSLLAHARGATQWKGRSVAVHRTPGRAAYPGDHG